ncbi:MAG: HlyD family secretion protein [Panacagrimonas sp.]
MTSKPLFRSSALAAQKAKSLGGIVLIRPLSYRVLTATAVVCALMVVAFLIWGTYTKRSTVSGQLVPDKGLVKVHVPQAGVVLEKHVVEGQTVKRGDLLYVMSSERQTSTQSGLQAAISSQVEARRDSLRDQMDKTQSLIAQEREALGKRLGESSAEVRIQEAQIDNQRLRVELARQAFASYEGLLARDFISREQLQQKEIELLDQTARLKAMERELLALQRERATRSDELESLEFKGQNQLLEFDRGISTVDQELIESEAKRRLVVIAPQTGVATAVLADVGQTMDGTRSLLLSIVPADATMQAQLFAPSRAVGFIKPGDPVRVRYQAFPYQKFGHAGGRVMSVAKTALLSSEMSGLGQDGQNNEPLYRVTVELDSQTVNAYGKAEPLQAGMLLEADILQDTRRLYEWVLEPLYSVTGKL